MNNLKTVNVARSRSENGKLYFRRKLEMSKPVISLFELKTLEEGSMLLRHVELGTIKFSFHSKTRKQNVEEVEVTEPFILNALCYDAKTRTYIPNNSASAYFRRKLSSNEPMFLEALKKACTSNGLESEYVFFIDQFNRYCKYGDVTWLIGEDEKYVQCVQPQKYFFSRMEHRYKRVTGKTFNLNPHALSYIYMQMLIEKDENVQNNMYTSLPSKLHVNDVISYFIRKNYNEDKIKIHMPVKEAAKGSKIQKFMSTMLSWTKLGVSNENQTTHPHTFENEADYNLELNYTVMPRLESDYSWLARIDLETIPPDLWLEIYRLNKHVPTFLIPESTRAKFTDEELTGFLRIVPELIIEWNRPDLYNNEIVCDLPSIYPHLTEAQQSDLTTISMLKTTNRHLVPKKFTNYSKFPDDFFRLGSLNNVYDLLDENLRTINWSNLEQRLWEESNCHLLELIPNNEKTKSEYREILKFIVDSFSDHDWIDDCNEPYRSIHFKYLPSVLTEDPERLFNELIQMSKDCYSKASDADKENSNLLMVNFGGIDECAPADLLTKIELANMTIGNKLVIDRNTIARYEKILFFRKMDSIIPNKIEATVPKRLKI